MLRLLAILAPLAALSAQPFLPLSEVKPGQRGIGRTVFAGSKIEEFQVEILGVLDNVGPRQSIILGRLSGGPLAHSGVMQGMSGSPVYIGGRLIGAVASAFQFSKDPIAGIRPIEEMLRDDPPDRPAVRAWVRPDVVDLAAAIPARAEYGSGATRMIDIASPLSMSGFTTGAIEQFAPQLRRLGLEPMQGAAGGSSARLPGGDPKLVQPGSMISVHLMTGDLAMGADGTVTHVQGGKVYAFGHRFLAIGHTDLPFSRADVIALLPNLSTSFKISAAREWMGSITADYSTAVSGRLGRRPSMIPIAISLKGDRERRYEMQVASDKLLTPFLVQMATYSAIDATERGNGAMTIGAKGVIDFNGAASARIDTLYSMEAGAPLMASLAAALPVGYALNSGFPELGVRRVTLELDVRPGKRQFQIDNVWTSRSRIRPGESVDIFVSFTGPGGEEIQRKTTWRAPAGLQAGPVNFTVSEAMIANLVEHQQSLLQPAGSASQVRKLLDGLKPNNVATLRVWRAEPVFQLNGQTLPDPPPSVAMVLKRMPTATTGVPAAWGARIGEAEFRLTGVTVSGSKSAQVEVKE